MTSFTDTHTHLYLPEFAGRIDHLLAEADQAGINRFVLPNIEASGIESTLALQAAYPRKMKALMGLHPCSVKENYREELATIKNYLDHQGVVGIGEIGLDFYWDKTFVKEQEEAFRIQISWAMERGWPMSIHSRESTDRAIEIVQEMITSHPQLPKGFTPVFHCFTGSKEQANKIISLGGFLGIGGVVTFKNAGLFEVLSGIPAEALLLETDAPYLAPVPFRGKENIPVYLLQVAKKVAEATGKSIEEISRITQENALRIFGFH